jgi:hypothetical protein
MPDVTATELSKGVRSSTYRTPETGAPAAPAFLVMPTTVGRRAVQTYHAEGAAPARAYLNEKFQTWLSHTSKSMRGNATNTIKALGTYIDADVVDGCVFVGPGVKVVLRLPSGTIATKVDVVTTRQGALSGRAVFWDGQPITLDEAQVIAYPYAVALQRMYPNETVADICVWQVRRDNLYVVGASEALARAGDADTVLARL